MTTPFSASRSKKSMVLAVLLTIFLGPFGLFYATISGGLIMTFVIPVVLVAVFALGLVSESFLLLGWSVTIYLILSATYWLISIIWAVISVNSYNEEVDEDNRRQFELWISLQKTNQSPANVNIHERSVEAPSSKQSKTGVTSKPNLQEWLRNNPDKSINDYFEQFGR